jgi:hypothetical protein
LKTALLLLAQIFTAPDGPGGGGSPVLLEDWIKRLNEAEKKDRKGIVEEMAKALGVKTGEAWQKLKEAGWTEGNAPPPPPAPREGTIQTRLRHKTPYPHYRRAGVVLTNRFETYALTKDQLKILSKDPWVEVENGKK